MTAFLAASIDRIEPWVPKPKLAVSTVPSPRLTRSPRLEPAVCGGNGPKEATLPASLQVSSELVVLSVSKSVEEAASHASALALPVKVTVVGPRRVSASTVASRGASAGAASRGVALSSPHELQASAESAARVEKVRASEEETAAVSLAATPSRGSLLRRAKRATREREGG